MVILLRLTDTAVQWVGPHIIRVAADAAIPWANVNAFAKNFEDHFCAVNNKNAAITKLNKLVKQSHKLGTVKDYTMQFNAIVAQTTFLDDNKCDWYMCGLLYKI